MFADSARGGLGRLWLDWALEKGVSVGLAGTAFGVPWMDWTHGWEGSEQESRTEVASKKKGHDLSDCILVWGVHSRFNASDHRRQFLGSRSSSLLWLRPYFLQLGGILYKN